MEIFPCISIIPLQIISQNIEMMREISKNARLDCGTASSIGAGRGARQDLTSGHTRRQRRWAPVRRAGLSPAVPAPPSGLVNPVGYGKINHFLTVFRSTNSLGLASVVNHLAKPSLPTQ
jgi:hypothetical protein